ncbi:hypothetical protein H5410_022146 [Solanum commersonii]|uniref:Uncharacterized protein n=1 Tax=Solanum commersonii TaxID=4109 RepID=A0A9J5ZDD3_SOLCO|nr:hypothetical protein H5410_022146 [Solanum commersonii]
MLANRRRYQLWLARIGCNMCVSGKLRRPTAGGISQGLHASNVACLHRASNIGKWQATSAKACTHRMRGTRQDRQVTPVGRPSPRLARIDVAYVRDGQAISAKACTRLTRHARDRKRRPTLRQRSTKARDASMRVSRDRDKQRRPMASNIIQGLHASKRVARWPTDAANNSKDHPRPIRDRRVPIDIGRGMRASAMACAYQPGRGLPALAVAYAHRSANVGCSLPALSMACSHWSTNVGRGLPTSSVAYTQWSADVGRGLPASSVACTHWSTNVERACQHRSWPIFIVQGTNNVGKLSSTSVDRYVQATGDAARPRPTSADRCVQATDDAGRPRSMSPDRCVQATDNAGKPRSTSVDRRVPRPVRAVHGLCHLTNLLMPRPMSPGLCAQAKADMRMPWLMLTSRCVQVTTNVTQPSELIFFPKLQIHFANFPCLHYSVD